MGKSRQQIEVPKPSSVAKKLKTELERAFREMKLHETGKIQLKTARQLLDEL